MHFGEEEYSEYILPILNWIISQLANRHIAS